MKRLRSSDDLDSYNSNEKSSNKDKDSNLNSLNPSRSSRSFYYKSDNVRKGLLSTSSSRYDRDRSVEDDIRESSRMVRKRSDHGFDGFDRRKGVGAGFDRYATGREGHSSGGGSDRIVHRPDSFVGSRREFPKGFRSERDRSRREGSVSSWRRFGAVGKELEDSSNGVGRGGNEERLSVNAVSRSSPKGLRDAKSPSWSRDSGSEQTRVVRGAMRDDGKGKSSNSKSRSSPTWSKDSGSERSKSVEVTKRSEVEAKSVAREKGVKSVVGSEREVKSVVGSEREVKSVVGSEREVKSVVSKMEVKSVASKVEVKSVSIKMEVKSVSSKMEVKSVATSRNSSEMEEGELEPEPESVSQVVKEDETYNEKGAKENVDSNADCKEVESEAKIKVSAIETEKQRGKASVSDGNKAATEVDEMSSSEGTLDDDTPNNSDDEEVGNIGGAQGVEQIQNSNDQSQFKGEEHQDILVQKPACKEEECRVEKAIDLEEKVEDVEVPKPSKEGKVENEGPEFEAGPVTENLGLNLKDKGKSVAVSPVHAADSAVNGAWIGRESRNIATCRDEEDDMEGPSTRGFELFTSSPVRRSEKAEEPGLNKTKDEKLLLEPLDLSLSLPNVLLPIGASGDATQAPGSPSHGRSVQSFSTFRTSSDGFTASMSFSGSQSFFHNPSCSLTQNSLDMDNYEQSVHSRPIFQGIDWSAQTQNDSKHKDVTLYQKVLMNGNCSVHQSQAVQGMSNGDALQGNSKNTSGLERHRSFHEQLSGQNRIPDETRSSAQSAGSHDIGSNYSLEKKRAVREKHSGSLYRSSSQKEQEQFLIGGADFVETIISRIISEPIHIMARIFHERTGQSAALVKESIREMMLNADKQVQLFAFQTALQNRSDLTLDVLLKSHRFQLEILVALKTGLKEYLRVDSNISSSDLAEVFLNLRCRNLSCRSPLPVDECDCKVCSKKSGFCSACMCLVCSKFDMASQTCSWVGCDVCLHWCHADCALRESYIRNVRGATGAQGSTEMQFHCVACSHPSEMFGFVKEVFQNFAKNWSAETFCKELEYVKRIFSGSKDVRGRRLHEIAVRMLEKLAKKSNLPEVYSHIMGFITDSESSKFSNTPVFSGKEQGNGSNGGIAGPSQEASWLKSVYIDKAPHLERSASLLPTFHTELPDKRLVDLELERYTEKEPLFDELESIVKIKHAEAKMFQARADDARRDAEGLKRITVAKSEKIEEEYKIRISKLRIVEAEEMRKQKYEEFQALERAHREYFNMKVRMEADIKDLLLKMEAAKRNLAM